VRKKCHILFEWPLTAQAVIKADFSFPNSSFTTLKNVIMKATLLDSLKTFNPNPTLSAKMPVLSCLIPALTLSTTWIPKSVSCLTPEKETAMKQWDLPSQLMKNAVTPQQQQLQQHL
jgi:hypothetical protein